MAEVFLTIDFRTMTEKLNPQPVLVAQGGDLKGSRWAVEDQVTIGRSASNEIVVSNHQVSRKHAQVLLSEEGPLLKDLNSKNGTFLNGKPVTDPELLKDGDMIQIALAQKFVYLGQDATVPLSPGDFEDSVLAYFRRIRLDKDAHRVWIRDREIDPPLSALQFSLLLHLYEAEGSVLTRTEIIHKVWGTQEAAGVTDQALDALIRRLRDRLEERDPNHEYIVTVRGQGFRLDNPPFKTNF
jgi:DNA-binding winged helix-turn-helix (wHTH) protein